MYQGDLKGPSAPFTISSAAIPLGEKVRELARFFQMRAADLLKGSSSTEGVFAGLAEYESLLLMYAGRPLRCTRAFEIGFGPRPNRLFALAGLGADIQGIDLDVPLLRGHPREFFEMYRRNGLERVVKSLIRFPLFDLVERRRLDAGLRRRGSRLRIDPGRLLIGDAVNLNLPAGSLDLIYAEDVFEHIPPTSLDRLIAKMRGWLTPGGLALVRPCIFPGIAGGHLAEWSPSLASNLHHRRRSEPWEHLRQNRFEPNTYLNRLSRADYRRVFTRGFEILEERVRQPDLGRGFLTARTSRELDGWAEEELFSNQVFFVLRPR